MLNQKIPTPIALVFVAIFGFFFVSVIQVKIQSTADMASALSALPQNSNSGKQNPNPGTSIIKEKVILFGGMQDNGVQTNQLNDVWVTSNMSNWNVLLNHGHNLWQGRSGFGAVYFNNNLWMVGGRKATNQNNITNLTNEVWRSSDGLIWEHVDFNQSLPGIQNPAWSARLATNSLLVFDDGAGAKIWLVGGYTETGLPKNDVWAFDGNSWVQKVSMPTNTGSFLGTKFSANSLNGNIFVTGYLANGNVLKYTPANSSWVSLPNFGTYKGHAISKNGNTLYSFGGKLFANNTNDSKKSLDGVNWTSLGQAGFNPRALHKSINFLGKIWILGGFDTNALSQVWAYSPDTNTWVQTIFNINNSPTNYPLAPWLARKEFGLVVVPANFGVYN